MRLIHIAQQSKARICPLGGVARGMKTKPSMTNPFLSRLGLRLTLAAATLLGCAVASATDLHVSPAGHDGNPGSKDKPLATLTAARDAIRKLKQAGPLRQAVTVHVAAGTYVLDRPAEFTRDDSGTATALILYLAEGGAATGCQRVTSRPPVSRTAAPPSAR